MPEKTVHIPSIMCGHCVMTIKRELSEIEGVVSVEGSADTKMVTVAWEDPAGWDTVKEVLDDIGYSPE